jgi:hypothetical protein
MRDAFEKGLASVVARWMLDGSAEAVIARVAKSGVLGPEEVENLRRETTEHLQKVRDEGAAYAELVTTALKEVAAHLPLGGLATAAVSAAGAVPWKDAVAAASRVAMEVATASAAAAAQHAQTLHETLEAQRQARQQATEKADAASGKPAGPANNSAGPAEPPAAPAVDPPSPIASPAESPGSAL